MGVERFLAVQNILGEGPVWDDRLQALHWVDITAGAVWRCGFASGEVSCETYGENVGMVQLAEDGRRVIALEKDVLLEGGAQRSFLMRGVEADRPENRFNDGICDPAGRLWLGTMHRRACQGQAALYRLTAKGECVAAVSSLSISNGLAFSPDNAYLYHVDTPSQTLYRYAFDVDSGALGPQEPWLDYSGEKGDFDGITTDAQGVIWAAHWGGFQVSCWDPVSRKKLGSIPVPVPNVTACCFAGEKLDTLMITTGMGRDTRPKKEYPALGSLFACQPGAVGLPPNRMRL